MRAREINHNVMNEWKQAFNRVSKDWPEDKEDVWKSFEWEELREEVLYDAGYVCAECGSRATTVHHRTYAEGIICDKKHLVALCWNCHRYHHYMRRTGKYKFARDRNG